MGCVQSQAVTSPEAPGCSLAGKEGMCVEEQSPPQVNNTKDLSVPDSKIIDAAPKQELDPTEEPTEAPEDEMEHNEFVSESFSKPKWLSQAKESLRTPPARPNKSAEGVQIEQRQDPTIQTKVELHPPRERRDENVEATVPVKDREDTIIQTKVQLHPPREHGDENAPNDEEKETKREEDVSFVVIKQSLHPPRERRDENADEMDQRRYVFADQASCQQKQTAIVNKVRESIARKSTTQEIIQLRAIFEEIDRNNNQTPTSIVTLAELRQGLKKEYGDTYVDGWFLVAEMDHILLDEQKTQVNYKELLSSAIKTRGYLQEERIAHVFRVISEESTLHDDKGATDKDQDDDSDKQQDDEPTFRKKFKPVEDMSVTVGNLRAALVGTSMEKDNEFVHDLVEKADPDRDGKIAFVKFRTLLREWHNSQHIAWSSSEGA